MVEIIDKVQNRLVKVHYVLLLAPVFQGFFFVVAINSTIEANKVGSMHL